LSGRRLTISEPGKSRPARSRIWLSESGTRCIVERIIGVPCSLASLTARSVSGALFYD
jgi:hypothetical protein